MKMFHPKIKAKMKMNTNKRNNIKTRMQKIAIKGKPLMKLIDPFIFYFCPSVAIAAIAVLLMIDIGTDILLFLVFCFTGWIFYLSFQWFFDGLLQIYEIIKKKNKN